MLPSLFKLTEQSFFSKMCISCVPPCKNNSLLFIKGVQWETHRVLIKCQSHPVINKFKYSSSNFLQSERKAMITSETWSSLE